MPAHDADGSTPGDASKKTRWIWLAVATVLIAVVTGWLWGQVESPGAASPGHPAPAFSASVIGERGNLSLAGLKGKPVVLNFWASWCGPCKAEAPLLNKAFDRYRDRVAFVGVDSHDARSDAEAFLKANDVRYPSVFDGGAQIYRDYGLTGQPETFFIDSDGRIVAHVPGALYGSILRQDIARLLG